MNPHFSTQTPVALTAGGPTDFAAILRHHGLSPQVPDAGNPQSAIRNR